jgi:hypothetical protein
MLLAHGRSLAYSLVWSVLVLLFRSRVSSEAEILIFRHQLNIQRRHVPKRVAFSAMDCLSIVGLYRLVPNAIEALTIMKADIVTRWHRAGFRSYWRWKSRKPLRPTNCIVGNSPADPKDEHRYPLWERRGSMEGLLKLGIEIGQTSVAKYMARRRGPLS